MVIFTKKKYRIVHSKTIVAVVIGIIQRTHSTPNRPIKNVITNPVTISTNILILNTLKNHVNRPLQ
jgi:hypothetical protein